MTMAIDPRKRQKKLERRSAKQKAKKRELVRRNPQSLAGRMDLAAAWPILHCCVIADLWTDGIGNVLVSRHRSNGDVAAAMFLVDVYCLGVKDAFVNFGSRPHYEKTLYDTLQMRYKLVHLRPECARKLVEGAVRYALDLGLSPHADYRAASRIFGDIDAAACDEAFTYGNDGKPYFIAGPRDDQARCQYVMNTLTQVCGSGGFHFLMPAFPTEKVLDLTPEY
jgi:hypothetical protein